ncbi:MAG: hypothetical protein FJ318_08270 [SAR202 cluster bacterium]|nr:hypothetical protein [SAR202 cluster bacterium]
MTSRGHRRPAPPPLPLRKHTVLDELASSLGRDDEEPNVALAGKLAANDDAAAIRMLVDHLRDERQAIAGDCIKVLYGIGARKPELIGGHVDTFIDLLESKQSRLAWGAMTALGAVAAIKAPEIARRIDAIIAATDRGSAITQDWGVRVLAMVARKEPALRPRVMAFLLGLLDTCPPKDLPRHAESALLAASSANKRALLDVLQRRRPTLNPSQGKRVDRVIATLSGA